MSRKEKLIARLKGNPKDFTFDEVKTLSVLCGYVMSDCGKTSGSRVKFTRGNKVFRMHKPHPQKEIFTCQVNDLLRELKLEGLI